MGEEMKERGGGGSGGWGGRGSGGRFAGLFELFFVFDLDLDFAGFSSQHRLTVCFYKQSLGSSRAVKVPNVFDGWFE